jgi:hypothetical protein
MSPRLSDRRIYMLTAGDVVRIKGLLASVEEAVAELLEYRRVLPLDPEADFPLEDAVYEQTSKIMQDCELPLDKLF